MKFSSTEVDLGEITWSHQLGSTEVDLEEFTIAESPTIFWKDVIIN